jgi:selenoprotein W-related protein
LLEEFEFDLDELVLLPSKGGVFEVEVDGDLVFSKKERGRHAELDEILTAVRPFFAK